MKHGTISGNSAHINAGERPCEACLQAKSEYDRKYRARPGRPEKAKKRSAARYKALQVLKERHPQDYRNAYQGWRERLARVDMAASQKTATAQSRARVDLKRKHEDEYHELYWDAVSTTM